MNNITPIITPLKRLLSSSKFWVALIVAITGAILYVRGVITPEQLGQMLTTLAVIVIGAIAGEDMVNKAFNGKQ